MARFDGYASIRRAITFPNGVVRLDLKPDGMDWSWYDAAPDHRRECLAVAIAALSGGWKVALVLPDDPGSGTIEAFGLTNSPDR